MQLHALPFSGHYENGPDMSETLQLAVPENDAEREAIAAAILPEPELVDDDSARRDYEFEYALGDHLGNGLFALRIAATDASNADHAMEIAAGLAITGVTRDIDLSAGVPMWFISKRLHYKSLNGRPQNYHGTAFGRLIFPDPDALPQRRLFGAVV